MRKVDVVRPPINYVVFGPNYKHQIAWFLDLNDAREFINTQYDSEEYEIAEVRK